MDEAEELGSMERAWLEAAEQLEIRITVPYGIPSDPGPVRFTAYLPDFGGANGMVIGPIRRDSDGDTRRVAAKQAGGYFSELSEEYHTFDRNLFIDTLNDWGWFGPEDSKPNWYTGEAWG